MTTRRGFMAGLAAAMAFPFAAMADAAPEVRVTKDPTCGCCAKWVEHLRSEGFVVHVTEGAVGPVRARLGVPRDLASCHTAECGGYVLEGHVPAHALRRLLAERPDGAGLAVPGMPMGSPGMEVDGADPVAFDVVMFGEGRRSVFGRYVGNVPA